MSPINNAKLNYILTGLNFHIPMCHLHKEILFGPHTVAPASCQEAPNEITVQEGSRRVWGGPPAGGKGKRPEFKLFISLIT